MNTYKGKKIEGSRAAAAGTIRVVVLVCGLLSCWPAPNGLAADYTPPQTDRQKILLEGPWRFHAGQSRGGRERGATTRGSDEAGRAPAVAPEARDYRDDAWAQVRVPHTWADRFGKPVLANAWYRTRFQTPRMDGGQRLYLHFEGVNTVADVYVNGTHLGQHRGRYTAFAFDATSALKPDADNVLAVKVSNDPREVDDCIPGGPRPFNASHGGIYRKVWLVTTPATHIHPDHGSSGVYITAHEVTAASVELSIKTVVKNAGEAARTCVVRHHVIDPEGKMVQTLSGKEVQFMPMETKEIVVQGTLTKPKRWSLAAPHLYTVHTEVIVNGKAADVVSERTGFRSIQIGKDGFFLLNGERIAIRGVNKHQETEHRLSAVDDAELIEDFDNLKDVGFNCVRLAHYPHSRLEYNLADERGILVWAENGQVGERSVTETGERITREMVRQNYNHPSIVFWSAGNESPNTEAVRRYAAVIKAEKDPMRLTTYAAKADANIESDPNLDFISMNNYFGWYGGQMWGFSGQTVPRYVSETGAGGVVTTHCDYGKERHVVNEYEPEEYQQLFAENRCQIAFRDEKDHFAMLLWWAFRDFCYPFHYKKNLNTKSLLTYAGHKKDIYYLFKSYLRPETPVVHIASKLYFLRRGAAGSGIKVYSNRQKLTLTINGVSQGSRANGEHKHANGRRVDNVFFWNAPLHQGRNEISVTDGAGHDDACVIYFHGQGGLPEKPDPDALVRNLVSSNPGNKAFYVRQDVQPQWPFYYELDGTADNSFDRIPSVLAGAQLISTGRLSKPENKTELSFELRRAATVFVMVSQANNPRAAAEARPTSRAAPGTRGASGTMRAAKGEVSHEFLTGAGFADTGVSGDWRDDAMVLVPYKLYEKKARAGETVKVPGTTADYIVLVKPDAPDAK